MTRNVQQMYETSSECDDSNEQQTWTENCASQDKSAALMTIENLMAQHSPY